MRIILTGPTGTLGKKILESLLMDSHEISIIGRDREKLEKLVNSLKEHGLSVGCISTADLKDIELSRKALLESITCLGGIDALINSAGVWDDTDPWDLSVNKWVEVYIINTIAPYMLSLEASKYMNDGGTIINIGCLSALRGHRIYTPLKPSPAYLASKVSITYLTKQLAEILAPRGIRVVTIAPSWIEKESLTHGLRESIKDYVPLKRAADPWEVVEVIKSILYMRTPYITGSVIEISGGL
ncbi:MAG TPA: SDR family oxidoreductase [Sulfolobales archaeon]|nr:SDR family oxidoreductase [Sulfolobales archaeon]